MNVHITQAVSMIDAARNRYLEALGVAHKHLRAAVIQDPANAADAKAAFDKASVDASTAAAFLPPLDAAAQPDGVDPTTIELVAGGSKAQPAGFVSRPRANHPSAIAVPEGTSVDAITKAVKEGENQ